MTVRYNQFASSGTANGVASGSQVNGTSVPLGRIASRLRDMSALVTCLAETSTLTFAAKWQVSNDNSTWIDCAHAPQNPAAVVLATGTAGADTAITRMIPAPAGATGWAWARLALVVGGTTGASADTFSVGYCYRQVVGGDR